jgi:hypothetical protein
MSIKVHYDPYNRVGNRTFQYIFGKILSTAKQVPLICDELLDFNVPAQNLQLQFTSGVNTRSYGDNYVNIEELINLDRDILIDSYVQKAAYYIDYRDQIKTWLNIPDTQSINANKLVVHIRETDYKDLNHFLGYDFYKKAIDKLGYSDVVIVTDNSGCETIQRLISDGCKLASEGVVDTFTTTWQARDKTDFYTLLASENVLISQSTFSWWTAFLGNHKNIFFPYRRDYGLWKAEPNQDDIDLFFDFGVSKKIIL